MSMFARSEYMETNIVNNVAEVDYKSFPISDKDFSDYSYYQITRDDIYRPINISTKIYGSGDYWWVILKINKVVDIWNDLVEGEILKFPPKEQIDGYLRNARSTR